MDMGWISKMARRLRFLSGRTQFEDGMDEEMRFHLEMKTREYLDAGMSPEEARAAAMRSFGNVPLLKEDSREVWGWRWLDDLFQDLRFSARLLAKTPGFTLVVVLSLALGIGANTAIFTLIDAVLLKMLPIRNPEQLRQVLWAGPHDPLELHLRTGYSTGFCPEIAGVSRGCSFSYPTFEQVRKQTQVFSHVFTFTWADDLNVIVKGQAALAQGELVSGGYFAGLGVKPLLGRIIAPTDDHPGAPPVAVISYGYWERRFGSDPTIVGKSVPMNGIPFTIIGVAPSEFFGLQPGNSPEIWVPLREKTEFDQARERRSVPKPRGQGLEVLKQAQAQSDFENRQTWWLRIMGRLKPGVNDAQARAELETIFRQSVLVGLTPVPKPQDLPRIELEPAKRGIESLRRQFSKPLIVLMVVVGLVLLIACANVANLLLARGSARQRELAVRLALGAARRRLVRQLLTESLLLSLIGGAVGLFLAYWGSHLLVTFMSGGWQQVNVDVNPDARILGFTLGVALVTGVLFGLVPALRGTRVDLTPALKAAGATRRVAPTTILGRTSLGLGKFLVVAQVAISLLLVVGASLFVRTLVNLETLDVGFNRKNLLLFSIDPGTSGYSGQRLAAFYRDVLERVAALPGVRSTSFSQLALISDSYSAGDVVVEGYKPKPQEDMNVGTLGVGPGFFETMGIPIVLGRSIGARDSETSPKVAVVSEAFARHYFPGQNPVGRRFGFSDKNPSEIEIVGVARNAKYFSLNSDNDTGTTAYMASLQKPEYLGQMNFEVRTAGNPMNWAPAIRQVVQGLDKNVPLSQIKTQTEQIDETILNERLFAKLTSFFGLLALGLACVGLYGTMSYTVVRRTNEIGIRMALGAQKRRVLGMVLKESLLLVAVGIALGLPLAFATTRLVKSFLFGLTPTDPLALLGSTLVLAAVAALAGYLPARRATRVDPLIALRYE
jgi:predicted permease